MYTRIFIHTQGDGSNCKLQDIKGERGMSKGIGGSAVELYLNKNSNYTVYKCCVIFYFMI